MKDRWTATPKPRAQRIWISSQFISGVSLAAALFLGCGEPSDSDPGETASESIEGTPREVGSKAQIHKNSSADEDGADASSPFESLSADYSKATVDAAHAHISDLARHSPRKLSTLLSSERVFKDPRWYEYAIKKLTEEHPDDVGDFAEMQPLSKQGSFLTAAISAFSDAKEWKQIESLLADRPAGPATGDLYGTYAYELSKQDIGKALELYDQADFREGRREVANRVLDWLGLTPLSQRNPDDMVAILQLPDLNQNDIEEATNLWCASKEWLSTKSAEPTEADLLEEVDELPVDEEVRKTMKVQIASRELGNVPEPSADDAMKLMDRFDGETERGSFAANATGVLAEKDIEQAASFALELDGQSEVSLSMTGLMAIWLHNDSVSASEWVMKLPHNSLQFQYGARKIVDYLERNGDAKAAARWETMLK